VIVTDEFDWDNEDFVVVSSQYAIAVYSTPAGSIIIREDGVYEQDTRIVFATLEAAEAVARAIMGEISLQRGLPQGPPAKDPTAAERQQRRREKQREAGAGNKAPPGAPSQQQPSANSVGVTPPVTASVTPPERDSPKTERDTKLITGVTGADLLHEMGQRH
jgi:hypothetical protein